MFDVVWQDSLAIWVFIKTPIEYRHTHVSLLKDTFKFEVRIGRQFSDPFRTKQGVGQDKIKLTGNYKNFIDPTIKLYRASRAGCCIGIYFVGSPTCADDVLLICNSMEELQILAAIADAFSRQERYNIHQKTKQIII